MLTGDIAIVLAKGLVGGVFVALFAVPVLVVAQTDEIQVYDGGLAPVGTFNLTIHSNFTPKGQAPTQ